MKILKTPQLRFFPLPKYAKYKYTLSDFSYGEMLLFENNYPKFYINIFDENFSKIKEYVLKNDNLEKVLKDIIVFNKLPLCIFQNFWGIDLVSKETVEEINLKPFPLYYFRKYLEAQELLYP